MNAKDDYDRAIAEHNKKNYDAALSSFKKASKKFTTSQDKAYCLYMCGIIYYETYSYSSAAKYFMLARDLFPDNYNKALCEYRRGIAHRENFEKEIAKKAFDNALSLLPPNSNWGLKSEIYRGYASLSSSIILGHELIAVFSENQRKKNQHHLKNAIFYCNEALRCDENSQTSTPAIRADLLFYRAGLHDKLDEHQKAHDDYTAAFGLNHNLLANYDSTHPWGLTNLVIRFPELYQKTLKAILLPKQLENVKKIELPKSTLEGFEKVASSLPENTDRNTKLQIYLDCADGYRKLGTNCIAFSKSKWEKNLENYKKGIQYYNLALTCFEGSENNAKLKGDIFFYLAQLYHALNEPQNAHDNYTSAYMTNPNLVNATTSADWLRHYIKDFPEFYANTFEPLLSTEQRKSAEKIQLEIKKSDDSKKKSQAFKTKIPFFSNSDKLSEKKSETERRDHGNYFLLSDEQDRGNKFN